MIAVQQVLINPVNEKDAIYVPTTISSNYLSILELLTASMDARIRILFRRKFSYRNKKGID